MALGFNPLGSTAIAETSGTKQTRTIVTAGYTGGHVRTLSATATAVEIDVVSSTGASLSIDNTGLVTSQDNVTQTQEYEYRIFDGTWGDYLTGTVFIATELDEKSWTFTGAPRSTYDSNDTVGPPPSSGGDLLYTAAGPYIHAEPNVLTMRRTVEDLTQDSVLAIKNTGSSSTTVDGVTFDSGGTYYSVVDDPTPTTIAPGATLNITFRFSPVSATSTTPEEAVVTIGCGSGAHDQRVVMCGSKVASAPSAATTISNSDSFPYTLDSANTNFELSENISVSGRAFTIGDAKNMTLDLNGYTITYNTGKTNNTNAVYFGTGLTTPMFFELTDGATGGGIIQAASDTSSASHAIFFSTAARSIYVDFNNIDIDTNGEDAHCITDRGGEGISRLFFHHNTLNCTATTTSDRHNLTGYQVHIRGGLPASDGGYQYSQIHGNTINGGSQGGITNSGEYSQLYNNTINHTATNTNGFGIRAAGQYQRVFNNTVGDGVEDVSGRGIMVQKPNVIIHSNTVEIRQDRSEVDGTNVSYGIQIDVDNNVLGASGVVIYENDVTVQSSGIYAAQAMRISELQYPSVEPVIHDNTFRALRDGAASGSTAETTAAIGCASAGTGVRMHYNDYVTDKNFIYMDTSGWVDLRISDGTLSDGSGGFTAPTTGNVDEQLLFLYSSAANSNEEKGHVDATIDDLDITGFSAGVEDAYFTSSTNNKTDEYFATGDATITSPDELVDNGANFVTSSVTEGMQVINNENQNISEVDTGGVEANKLTLIVDNFVDGDSYSVGNMCRYFIAVDGVKAKRVYNSGSGVKAVEDLS